LLVGVAAPAIAATDGSAPSGRSERLELRTDRLQVVFSIGQAVPIAWRACHPACDVPRATSVAFGSGAGAPPARFLILGGETSPELEQLRFALEASASEPVPRATFAAEAPGLGIRVVRTFELSPQGYEVVATARVEGPGAAALMAGRRLALELRAGSGLDSPPGAGFSASLDDVRRVTVAGGTVHAIEESGRPDRVLPPRAWTGVRNRFWVLLARSDDAVTVVAAPGGAAPLALARETGPLSARYVLYAGPTDRAALMDADPALGGLLFASLWSPLRALSLGVLLLLHGLAAVVREPGPAVVALALTVKALLWPLTVIAHRLQQGVDATRARLQPRLEAIRATSRGEERTRRTVALYREEGVHPLYTLKGLVGVLIQLPVFIAVFDALAEDFGMHRASFLWIADLARPDALLPLPVAVPFLGGYLNALPVLMTAISLTAALRFVAPALPEALVRRQRRNLAGMAALFFLLFYTFPAGMVLYWTCTNAIQLAASELARGRAAAARSGQPDGHVEKG
jgi:YidC/Oxa1 family membrane protein insertase